MSAYLSNNNAILAWIHIDSWCHGKKSILDTDNLMNVVSLLGPAIEKQVGRPIVYDARGCPRCPKCGCFLEEYRA